MNSILSHIPSPRPCSGRTGGPSRLATGSEDAPRDIYRADPDWQFAPPLPRTQPVSPSNTAAAPLSHNSPPSALAQGPHGTLFQDAVAHQFDWHEHEREPLFDDCPWIKSDKEPHYEESWDEPLYPDQVYHGAGLPRSSDFPLQVRREWSRCFETTPREFFETLFDTTRTRLGDYSFTVQEDGDRWNEVALEMNLDCPISGRQVGRMDRLFQFPDEGGSSVHHQLFELDPVLQGQGVAKELLANSMELYEQAGIAKISLFAALDVGGYAWAKYGFSPEPGRSTRELFLSLKERLAELDGVSAPVRAVVTRLLESDDPKAIWAISDLEGIKVSEGGKTTTLGKALLLGSHWKGQLSLNDPEARARFDQYISRTPKAGKV